jgi:predicted Zn-dependent protease
LLYKLVPILFIVVLIWILFFSHTFRPLGRWLGRRTGDVKNAGRELIDGEEVPNSPIARYEKEVGKTLTARVLAENAMAPDMRIQDRVYRIGHRLAGVTARQQLQFRFAALDDGIPHAISIPGGSVFVSTALVDLCGSDDNALAGILAHEIAHIDQRHAVKSMATRAVTRAGLRAIPILRGALVHQLASGVENLLDQGFSEDREFEADLEGSRLAEQAGFDPLGLCRFLATLPNLRPDPSLPAGDYLKYFQSHPPAPRRIKALQGKWS